MPQGTESGDRMSIKIIHAADLHLDSAFEALGDRAAERRREQRELLRRIAELTREREADILLLAGDLLDSGSAYAETGAQLCAALAAVECPVFIAPGNHDYYCAASPYARLQLPENVHVFKKARLECVELPEPGLRVWGAGFEDMSCPGLLEGVHIEKTAGVTDICVIHGEVDKPGSRYCPISRESLENSGMDYVALGHVHTGSGLQRAGDTYYAWPGCPEGRGFDETGEKGVYFIELGEDFCTAEFIATSMRKYEILEVDISGTELEKALPADTAEDIYRLILTGEVAQAPNTAELADRLKERFYALQIKDRTRPRRDIWEKAEQDSLTGLFLRKMKAMYDSAAHEDERQFVVQAVRWGLAALENGEAVSAL